MDESVVKSRIASFNNIMNRFKSAIMAKKIVMEHQVRKFCVTAVIEHVWGFVAGFGENGSYTEEEDYAVGTSKIKIDNILHCYDCKVVVESKGPNENLDDHIGQLGSYVKISNSSVGIITNGTEWRIYLASRTGEMSSVPFRVFDIESMSDEDVKFFVTLFDSKHNVNASAMRREQEFREKQNANKRKYEFFLSGLKDFVKNPSDEWIKERIRSFENIASVSSQKLEEYKKVIVPAAADALRDEICKVAIMEERAERNKKNKVEVGEFAIYTGCRVFAKQKGISLKFVDDEDARYSHIEDAKTGRNLMYIVGDVDGENGWTFRGIAFPNRTKGRGSVIQCDSVEDVDAYHDRLIWVAENIERSAGEWAELYDGKFFDK